MRAARALETAEEETARLSMIHQLEKMRGTRVIVLIHRQEALSFFGIPVFRFISVEDSEEVLRANHMTPPDMPRWGQAAKDWMRKNYRYVSDIKGPVQDIPSPDARVTLDPDVRDHWGIPVARLSGATHPETLKTAAFLNGKAREWVLASGAVEAWGKPPTPMQMTPPTPAARARSRMGPGPSPACPGSRWQWVSMSMNRVAQMRSSL